MSVKKLLILTAAGVASVGASAAMAAAPSMMATTPAASDNYFYVEGNLGYAIQGWSFQQDGIFGAANFPTSTGNQGNGVKGGFVYGADFGYMFSQHFGVELGWTYLPRFTTLLVSPPALPGSLSFRSAWGAWATLKTVVNLTSSIDAFFKAGLSYRRGTLNFSGMVPARMRELRPMIAIGGTYNFAESWMVSLQWMHFMGGTTYATTTAPPPAVAGAYVVAPPSDLITMSVGYKFTV